MRLPTKSKVYFFFETSVSLRNRTSLKKFIEYIFKSEGYPLKALNYIFTTDKRLLEINQQFLKHNYYTDIITFGLSRINEPIEAEVYISIDRVKDNAEQLNESFTRELLRVIFHGSLHLAGYKDKTPKEKAQIRQKENFYLSKYGKVV